MLAEMGVRVWQPVTTIPPHPAPAVTPSSRPAPALAVPVAVPRPPVPAVAKPDATAVARLGSLPEQRQQSVFAEGAPVEGQGTDWLIIGDAPNDSENASGKPFSGPEADLLNAMLLAMGLHRPSGTGAKETVVLVNALKCKPPAQRNPHADELAQCRHFLNRQIELLQPRVILALGRLASMAVLHDSLPDVHAVPLGKLRGQVHLAHGRPVIVSYHPAYLMRTPSDKAKAWSDLCLAMQQLRSGVS